MPDGMQVLTKSPIRSRKISPAARDSRSDEVGRDDQLRLGLLHELRLEDAGRLATGFALAVNFWFFSDVGGDYADLGENRALLYLFQKRNIPLSHA